jgi:hypothetical protein
VIAEPPMKAGATHVTTELALALLVALTPVGTPGTLTGVAGFDAPLGGPLPTTLNAKTVKVYVVPPIRPVTVQEVAVAGPVLHVFPPGEAVTV